MESGSVGGQHVALVTGSARGIGLAVARAFQARGERVHVVWRSSHTVVDVLEHEFPGRVHRADLTSDDDARQLIAEVVEREGRLDWLVHAVGEYVHGPLEHQGVADLRHMFASNVESSFRIFGEAREALRAAHGAALFFGGAALEGARGRRDTALHTSAKSALRVLVRSWALEEAAHAVRVNMVSPGVVPHPAASADTRDPLRSSRVPIGRPARVGDLSSAALFLCSSEAAHITGVDLEVAGGFLLGA